MTNEFLTKIVDAILEKYERVEAVQLIIELFIELLQEKNVPLIPKMTWGGDITKVTRDFCSSSVPPSPPTSGSNIVTPNKSTT